MVRRRFLTPAHVVAIMIAAFRTCFETNLKGSTYLKARREFESVLFNDLYEHPSVQPKDRPKYVHNGP